MAHREIEQAYAESASIALEYICKVAGYDMKKLVEKDNHYECVLRRRVVSAVLRKYGFTLDAIGRVIKRDHATISCYFRGMFTKEETKEMNRILENIGGMNLKLFAEEHGYIDRFSMVNFDPDILRQRVQVDKISCTENLLGSMADVADSIAEGSISIEQLNAMLTSTILVIKSIRNTTN